MADAEFDYTARIQQAREGGDYRRIQDLEDEVADLKKERDALSSENGALKTRQSGIDGRLQHLEAIAVQLEAVLNNLQGANGINVAGDIITYSGALNVPEKP